MKRYTVTEVIHAYMDYTLSGKSVTRWHGGTPGEAQTWRRRFRRLGLPIDRHRGGIPANPRRQRAAVEARLRGATYAEIGRRLGYSRQRAHQVVARALR